MPRGPLRRRVPLGDLQGAGAGHSRRVPARPVPRHRPPHQFNLLLFFELHAIRLPAVSPLIEEARKASFVSNEKRHPAGVGGCPRRGARDTARRDNNAPPRGHPLPGCGRTGRPALARPRRRARYLLNGFRPQHTRALAGVPKRQILGASRLHPGGPARPARHPRHFCTGGPHHGLHPEIDISTHAGVHSPMHPPRQRSPCPRAAWTAAGGRR